MNTITELEHFQEELCREEYLNKSGQKDTIETQKIYEKFSYLFKKKLIEECARNKHEREGRLLYCEIVNGFVGNKLKKISDAESTFESSATVSFAGKEVPFREVPLHMMNADDRKLRKEIFNSCKPIKRKLTSFSKKSLKTSHKLIEKLTGFKYVDYCSYWKEVNYDELANQLREFLVKTKPIHAQILDKQMKSIGVKISDAKTYDYAYVLRAKKYDHIFSKNELMTVGKGLWQDLGFDIQKQVIIDIDERPKKVPRAFCMPVKVPQEVILVMKPHGGPDDFKTFLHESGHSEHFANTEPSLSFVFKNLGDYAISESYAFLIQYLLENRFFLQKYFTMTDEEVSGLVSETMEHKLHAFRRYAAKVIYELKLHTNDLKKLDENFVPTEETYKNQKEMYVDILTKATIVKYDRSNYLIDVDSGLYAADYVRAWLFESMLRHKLEEKFGSEWFTKKEAGIFLKELWKWGNSGKSLAELIQMIGYEKLDIKFITEDFVKFFTS